MSNNAISQPLEFNFSDTHQLINFLQHFGVNAMINWQRLSRQISGEFDIRLLIKTFPGKLEFWELCVNPLIKWDAQLITDYYDEINWHRLSSNEGLQFSDPNLFGKYRDKFNWDELSANPSFPHDIATVQKYESKINWAKLGSQLKAFIVYAGMDDVLSYEEIKQAETDVKLLLHFKSRWKYNRGQSGYKGQTWVVFDSIFDNNKIKWKDEPIRKHFINEIQEYNATYKNCK